MMLVTGASGLLGANLVLGARRAGRKVAASYLEHAVHFQGAESFRVDLGDPEATARLLAEVRPRWTIHCAAATDVDWCEAHPEDAERANAEASDNLARAVAAAGSRLVYVSTDAVFDGRRGGYRESDPPAPCNVYGRTKWRGEQLVQRALPTCLVVRTNIYGWNVQPKQSLAEWILARLETGQPVPGFQDVTFSPMLVNDLGEILLDLIDRAAEGLFHVAGSEALTKYAFARRVANVFGHDERSVNPVSVTSADLKAPRPRDTSLITEKVSRTLGRAMPGVDAGLERFKAARDSGLAAELRDCQGG